MDNLVNVPDRICLVWRAEARGSRYVVGELTRSAGRYFFQYKAGRDLEDAQRAGFEGHPAFRLDLSVRYEKNVLEVFSSRLPDRSRPDTRELLDYWNIADANVDEYSLIAITGARLPTDTFEFIAPFGDLGRCTFLTEVAGLSHLDSNLLQTSLSAGNRVSLQRDAGNYVDPFAVKVVSRGNEIGFIKKVHSESVANAMDGGLPVEGEATDVQRNGLLKRVQLRVTIG